ncbi:hypothetical protein EVJ58_g82 [Rhodofomes roseus]|uniref:Uncharacterized protein n=1 Tax=Rhodofomes roseus TaxID=34475 RepID=A0A4Y9Z7Y0_9APHY|nr:hypothetical protein EVJ58_g82 [Rhodofomes roseus]
MSSRSSRTAPPPYTEGTINSRNETSPLNQDFPRYERRRSPPTDSTSRIPWPTGILVAAVLCFVTVPVFSGFLINNFRVQTLNRRIHTLEFRLAQYPPAPTELDNLRRQYSDLKREWDLGLAAHKQLQDYDAWAQDRAAFEHEREQWLLARWEYHIDQDKWEQHRQTITDDMETWRKSKEDFDVNKEIWEREKGEWENERQTWRQEREAREREQERERQKWDQDHKREQQRWDQDHERERQRWDRDHQEEHDRWMRERESRQQQWDEEADRFRSSEGNTLGLTWTQVESHHCVAHGTREYTARLTFDSDRACEQMPVNVNGVIFTGSARQECKKDGSTLVSRWYIDKNEASCKMYWGDLVEKGCSSGKRRFEARLSGLSDGDDWMAMCSSTPMDIRGQHFDRPMQCEDRGAFYGKFGMWEVNDNACWTGHRLHKTVGTAHYYDTPAMYPNLPRANSSSNSSARTAPPPYSPGQAPSNGQHETSPLNVVFPGYGARTEPCSTSTSKTPFKLSSVLIAMTYIALFGVISIQALHLAKYPPTRAELAELKQEWDLELTAHKQMQDYDKWAQDRLAFERERDQWLVARREYLIDQDNWEQQRQSYEDDTESWRRAQEDYNLTKTFWDSEREAWELERKRWAREQEKRDKEWKADADKHRRGEGNALGVTWTGIESHHCVAYGTREYTARIAFDAAQACKQMPLTVNGAVFSSPQECTQDEDSFVSRWHIDVGEASCKVYWGDLSNKGCHGQGSSKRRYEARLWGAAGGEWEWIHMCRSTPIDIHGQHFKSPTECEDRGTFYGMFGIWDVDDDTCA